MFSCASYFDAASVTVFLQYPFLFYTLVTRSFLLPLFIIRCTDVYWQLSRFILCRPVNQFLCPSFPVPFGQLFQIFLSIFFLTCHPQSFQSSFFFKTSILVLGLLIGEMVYGGITKGRHELGTGFVVKRKVWGDF